MKRRNQSIGAAILLIVGGVTGTFFTGMLSRWGEKVAESTYEPIVKIVRFILSNGAEKGFAVFRDCPDVCPEMVFIHPGEDLMGTADSIENSGILRIWNNQKPQHRVVFGSPFLVSRFEITKRQFEFFVEDTNHYLAEYDGCAYPEDVSGKWQKRSLERNYAVPGFPQASDEPAVCVSYDDAKSYVKWLSQKTGKEYRLLSEAEWEYVARAGATETRPWGNELKAACLHANVADKEGLRYYQDWGFYHKCSDGFAYTAPVGSFQENSFGVFGTLGNVWEWVEDCFHESYRGAPIDGSAWVEEDCKIGILRGGSWYSAHRRVHYAFRRYAPIREPMEEDEGRRVTFGIRVARDL